MEEDLLRRAADLAERCERTASVTSTAFLTPAEQYALTNWARHRDCTLVLHGGAEGCERQGAFFLPFYLTAVDFDPAEHLRAVHFSAPFAAPGHRDYLGAILGLGIRREWVGDILVQAHGAFVFCLPSVEPELRTLEQVGRAGVKAAAVPLSAVPVPERRVRPVTFTVQSARLDAVVSGMFRLSRTSAAAQIQIQPCHIQQRAHAADPAIFRPNLLHLELFQLVRHQFFHPQIAGYHQSQFFHRSSAFRR